VTIETDESTRRDGTAGEMQGLWVEILGATVTSPDDDFFDLGIRDAVTGAVVDVDGIADGLDIAAAGVKELDGGSLFAAGVAYTTTADVEVYGTFLSANPTDNAQMEVEIHFLPPAP
jgi:hypothetical protein